MRHALPCLLLALLFAPVRAYPREGPAAEDAAAEALRTFRDGDATALTRLAEDATSDVWLLAEDWMASGERAAALALARASRRPDRSALLAWASSATPVDTRARDALEKAWGFFLRLDLPGTLREVQGIEPSPASPTSVRLLLLKGAAQRLLPEGGSGDASIALARVDCERLGWDIRWEEGVLWDEVQRRVVSGAPTGVVSLALRALVHSQAEEAAKDRAEALANAGSAVLEAGLPAEAVRLLDAAFQTLHDAGAPEDPDLLPTAALVAAALGQAHGMLGSPAEALRWGETAMRHYRTLADPDGEAYALRELGTTYADLGDHEGALERYRAAKRIWDHDAETAGTDLLILGINMGSSLQHLGRSEDALGLLREAARRARTLGDPRMVAVAEMNLAETYLREDAVGVALRRLRAAAEATRDDPLLAAYLRALQAEAHLTRGRDQEPNDRQEAERLCTGVVEDLSLPSSVRVLAHSALAAARSAAGRWQEALTQCLHALDLLDASSQGLSEEDVLAGRGQADLALLLARARRACVEVGDPEAASTTLDRIAGHAFLASLGRREGVRKQLMSEEARREETGLRLAEAQASRNSWKAHKTRVRAEIRRAEADLQRARAALIDWRRRSDREALRWARATGGPRVGTSAIRAALRPDEALVTYVLLPGRSAAVVLTLHEHRIVRLEEARRIVRACGALAASDEFSSPAVVEARREGLLDLLVAPLALPAHVRRLLVCPDGVLGALPWPYLLTGSGSPGLDVSLLPSSGILPAIATRRERHSAAPLLGLARPTYAYSEGDTAIRIFVQGGALADLEGTESEVQGIRRPGDVVLVGADATEAGLRRELSRDAHWRALHFATHGLLSRGHSGLSAIALTPGPGDDGFLTALEVTGLDLATDAAVLSACDLGSDPGRGGESVGGLVRAFLLAGSPRVLAGLWQVPDAATHELMNRFYAAWERKGSTTASALREAQAAVRRVRPHPRQWAAWVLWGVPD